MRGCVRQVTSAKAGTFIFTDVSKEMRQEMQVLCGDCDLTDHLACDVSKENLYRLVVDVAS